MTKTDELRDALIELVAASKEIFDTRKTIAGAPAYSTLRKIDDAIKKAEECLVEQKVD